MNITPSILYNYLTCPHKVWRDVNGPKEEESKETNPFVELLWERGLQHEANIVKNLSGSYLDLSAGTIEERLEKTQQAIKNKTPLIYQGVLKSGNLFGIPDLLQLQGSGKYVPIDIKSGTGYEGGDDGEDEGKLKRHYAVQLCVYVEILETMNESDGKRGFIIDIENNSIEYNLNTDLGPKTPISYWNYYNDLKKTVLQLMQNTIQNEPAMASPCKLCSWYSSCKTWCTTTGDITQIFYVGRKVRDILKKDIQVSNIQQLLGLNIQDLLIKKKADKQFLKGIGESTLTTAIKRGTILSNKQPPVAYSKFTFPTVSHELFFDIEDDPTQEIVYLHGVYERTKGGEQFMSFVAADTTTEKEKEAWIAFWTYIRKLPKNDYAVYYYSQHEKTVYKKLQKKYPDVISEQELDSFFSNPNVIDLYQLVFKNTDWPVGSYSIKELAGYCGFKWRDTTPSGALSIQWYNDYLKGNDPAVLKRILEYNEDDCKATLVLKDKLKDLFK